MNSSPEQLEALAAQTGFRPQTLEKVIRLGELAADIGRHPLLSGVLALKGGTALNLMRGAPARLSVDLDFDYVGQPDRDDMQRERGHVEHALDVIARGQGYQIQRSRDAHAGRKLYLSYTSVAGTRDRIEVDLNFLYRTPLGAISRRALWQPPGFASPRIAIVPLEELAAGKLRATLDRSMPRDLFDTVRLPHLVREVWGSSRIRRIHVALAATLPRPLYEYGKDRFHRVGARQVREQLVPMLQMDERPTAESLKEEAWRVIAPLVELEEPEREYIDRVHAGELRPELLFPDDETLVARLHAHPALQWKLANVQRHRKR